MKVNEEREGNSKKLFMHLRNGVGLGSNMLRQIVGFAFWLGGISL